jgi:hypothetical protein
MKAPQILPLLLVLATSSSLLGQTIIADHTIIDQFDKIPDAWIDSVKKMLLLLPGESHGRGYHYGLAMLEQKDSKYAVHTVWGDDRIPPETYVETHLRASRVYRTDRWEYWGCGEEEFWTSRSAIDEMKEGLQYTRTNYTGKIVFGFGWCWDFTWHNPPGGQADSVLGCRWAGSTVGSPYGDERWGIDYEDSLQTGNPLCLQNYLEAVEEYNEAVPGITTIFTTGPVDGYAGESGYQRYLKHEAMREYVRRNGGVLLDYADILCWDGGTVNTTEWGGHTYQIGHPDLASGERGYDGGDGGSHITAAGCEKLAKGLWWLLARVAGWEGTPVKQKKAPSTLRDNGTQRGNVRSPSVQVGTQATRSGAKTYTVGGRTVHPSRNVERALTPRVHSNSD